MTPEMLQIAKSLLVKHEGRRNFPYEDSLGNITIGVGYNLATRGLSDAWIDKQLEDDINYFYNNLQSHFEWFHELNDERQAALIDLCFMGFKKFLEFHKMIEHLSKGNFYLASHELLNSNYAKQLPVRAKQLSDIIKDGII